jgi:hypothetical protein
MVPDTASIDDRYRMESIEHVLDPLGVDLHASAFHERLGVLHPLHRRAWCRFELLQMMKMSFSIIARPGSIIRSRAQRCSAQLSW